MVPHVHIHLSAPGINHLTLAQFGLTLIAVGGFALTIYFGWIATTLHEKIDGIEHQTHMIITENRREIALATTAGFDLSDQAIQKIPQHISFVKQVRERVGFSWTRLLNDLESAVPKNIVMNAVSLDEKKNTVLLNGSTPSLQNLNQLIQQLENHQAFQDVILTQHANTEKKKMREKRRIVFSMKVSYSPNLPRSKAIKS